MAKMILKSVNFFKKMGDFLHKSIKKEVEILGSWEAWKPLLDAEKS